MLSFTPWDTGELQSDDADPGKDIFALLFLSFFLINAFILLCVSKPGEEAVAINTAGAGHSEKIDAALLGSLQVEADRVYLVQNEKRYLIPDDLKQFREEGNFLTIRDDQDGGRTAAILQDPGHSMTAGKLLQVVTALNNADIEVDFREVLNP